MNFFCDRREFFRIWFNIFFKECFQFCDCCIFICTISSNCHFFSCLYSKSHHTEDSFCICRFVTFYNCYGRCKFSCFFHKQSCWSCVDSFCVCHYIFKFFHSTKTPFAFFLCSIYYLSLFFNLCSAINMLCLTNVFLTF